ncbi:MAG: hypothetical protein N2517_01045 [Ignavibacteria bacterium]|nr:hypothetical protein [Ignavibacteria bacterium]
MNNTLAISCCLERLYIALVSQEEKGYDLKYLATTKNPLDLEFINNPLNEQSLDELFTLINQCPYNFDSVTFSIPVENAIITKIPTQNITTTDVISLIEMEIKQIYSQYNPSEFPTYLYNMKSSSKDISWSLAIIIPKIIFQQTKAISKKLGIIVKRIEICQICAHNSLLYNYPEDFDKLVALVNIAEKFADFSCLKGRDLYFYTLIKFNDESELIQKTNETIRKLTEEFNSPISSVYLFGPSLTRITLRNFQSNLSLESGAIKRLNPLRYFTTSLDEGGAQIAARIAHLLPPCIGSAIPNYHERTKII